MPGEGRLNNYTFVRYPTIQVDDDAVAPGEKFVDVKTEYRPVDHF